VHNASDLWPCFDQGQQSRTQPLLMLSVSVIHNAAVQCLPRPVAVILHCPNQTASYHSHGLLHLHTMKGIFQSLLSYLNLLQFWFSDIVALQKALFASLDVRSHTDSILDASWNNSWSRCTLKTTVSSVVQAAYSRHST
jgi:hypothetical protein